MKRIISIFVSIIMLLQVYAPSFAAGEEQKAVLEAAKEIQKVEEELRKEEKKVSEVVDEINQSVVAIIGKNTKYREQDYVYSKFPKNLQHGSGVIIDSEGRIMTNNHVVDGIEAI